MLEAFISLIFLCIQQELSYSGTIGKKFLKKKSGLDFDDAYQYQVAKDRDLKIVTMDKDFKKVGKKADILYIV